MENVLSSGFNFDAGVNLAVSILTKILFGLGTVMALLMVKQTSLMDRVVSIPIGGFLKLVTWAFFILCLILTIMAVLLV